MREASNLHGTEVILLFRISRGDLFVPPKKVIDLQETKKGSRWILGLEKSRGVEGVVATIER